MSAIPSKSATSVSVGTAYAQAVACIKAGRLDEAFHLCMSILAVRPNQADVHSLLGSIAYNRKDSAAAVKHFKQALKLDPDNQEIRLNIARVHRDFGQWAEAARAFEAAAKHAPDNAGILYDLGKAYNNLGRHHDAIVNYRRALPTATAPDNVETNLATALMKVGDLAEAERHFDAVLARAPTFMPALINLAILRDAQGRLDEALALLDRALAADPENVDAHYHHALALMTRERLTEGWTEYVWRFKRLGITTLHDRFGIPYWAGEPLQGKTLLIWTEQGLGDEVLLAGMIPDVLRRGGKCTLVCTQRLAPLFQRSFPDVRILTREDMKRDASPAGGADYQASLSQLGLHLRSSVAAFCESGPYLRTDPEKTATLRRRYLDGTADRLVGIAWHSANPEAGPQKSIPLTAWEHILRIPGYRFVSLQYGDHAEAHRTLKKQTGLDLIVDKAVDAKNDIAGFAAQVAAMDLVISISNTTVHIAGGLGIPVWTLLPASTGRIWYWFLDRSDSPWYPSMRIFRRQRGDGWEPTLDTVAQELQQWR